MFQESRVDFEKLYSPKLTERYKARLRQKVDERSKKIGLLLAELNYRREILDNQRDMIRKHLERFKICQRRIVRLDSQKRPRKRDKELLERLAK